MSTVQPPMPEQPSSPPPGDIFELVQRSNRGRTQTGVDTRRPPVLEIHQIWENTLVETLHVKPGRGPVTIGSPTGSLGWQSPGKRDPKPTCAERMDATPGIRAAYRARPSGRPASSVSRHQADTREFEDPFGVGVPLSPQPNLMNTPVLLFPTNDIGYGVVGLGGEPGSPHLATFADGIVGRNVTRTGSGNEVVVTSVAFNGDDFFGTALEGQVDFGLPGGGFYGSVPLCYSQILPLVEEGVRELTRDTVRQIMYAGMGNGVATADVSLEVLSNELINSFGLPESQVGYTRLGSVFSGQIDNYVTIGTDYAENNVDAYITTPHTSTLNVVWTSDVSTNFRSELGGIIEALEADDYQIRDLFIANGAISMDDYNNLKLLQNAMTAPNGFKDGVIAPDGTPMPDNFTPPYQTDTCGGFECLVAWIIEDIINGTNNSGNNADQPPLLAAGCLFGLAGTPEIAPQPATITGDSLGDTPATELVEAVEPVTPGREQSAESVNELVVTVHTTFVDLAYGPAVPASNFSLSMATGQPDVGGPGVHSIEISKE